MGLVSYLESESAVNMAMWWYEQCGMNNSLTDRQRRRDSHRDSLCNTEYQMVIVPCTGELAGSERDSER